MIALQDVQQVLLGLFHHLTDANSTDILVAAAGDEDTVEVAHAFRTEIPVRLASIAVLLRFVLQVPNFGLAQFCHNAALVSVAKVTPDALSRRAVINAACFQISTLRRPPTHLPLHLHRALRQDQGAHLGRFELERRRAGGHQSLSTPRLHLVELIR